MSKPIKLAMALVFGIPLVAIIGLVIVLSVYDANEFKPQIEQQAKQAGVNLLIEDTLSWSLFPLGIEIKKLKINDQLNNVFLSAEYILAQVDLFSIFVMQPSIQELSIDGLQLSLIQFDKDSANWSNIVKEKAEQKDPSVSEPEAPAQDSESNSKKPETGTQLNFVIGKIAVSNAGVSYLSKLDETELKIKPFNLLMTDIKPGAPIPLEIDFELSENKGNKLTSHTLASLTFTPDFKVIELTNFSTKNTILTEALANKELRTELNTNLKLDLNQNQLSLNDLSLLLNDSRWTGKVNVGLDNQAVALTLKGDQLNLDKLLPPPTEEDSTQEEQDTVDTQIENKELLPLDTLRNLDLDINLKQSLLVVKGLNIENIDIALTAKNGVISLKKLDSKLYEGSVALSGQVDATTETPKITLEKSISALNLGQLFSALDIQNKEDFGSLSGLMNAHANINIQGNNSKALGDNARADIEFDIANGAIKGINMKAIACEGFALVNRESVSTRDWPLSTPFDTIEGKAKLKNMLASLDFDLITSGLTIESDGSFNLKSQNTDIEAGLRVTGDLGENACRVNDKVKNIVIPVKCEGSITTPPKELCGLDSKRLLRSVEDLAKSEAKRKINKELDRALKKHLGDSEDSGDLKDAAKSLFKKLF